MDQKEEMEKGLFKEVKDIYLCGIGTAEDTSGTDAVQVFQGLSQG